MCSTPIHVTSSQLIASEIIPVPVVKALLYPGAVVNGLVKDMTVPSWNDLLDIYNLTTVKEASAVVDLQRLEVLFRLIFLCLIFLLHMLLFSVKHRHKLYICHTAVHVHDHEVKDLRSLNNSFLFQLLF